MFNEFDKFNQPLNLWDFSKIKNMNNMFYKCENFNHSLDSWNIYDFNRSLMFANCYTRRIYLFI